METKLLLATVLLLCSSAGALSDSRTSTASLDQDSGQTFSSHGSCGPSAPTGIAVDFHEWCTSAAMLHYRYKDFRSHCAAAMHRFCNAIKFDKSPGHMIGVMREHSDAKLNIGCIKTHYAGPFHHIPGYPAHAESERRKNCNDGYNTQRIGCLHAADAFCSMKLGANYAGYTPEWQQFACFPTVAKVWVANTVLKEYHHNCYRTGKYTDAETADCFSAAKRFCQTNYPGSTGGIPQGSMLRHGTMSMLVACYKAEYEGEFFGSRNSEYFQKLNSGYQVCNFRFHIDRATIAAAVPRMLKTETYDNKQSDVTMRREFSVSESETVTSTFSSQTSISIGVEVKVSLQMPFLFKGEMKISTSVTQDISYSRGTSTTKTWTSKSIVEVPPGKAIRKEARITRTQMNVPFTAQVRTRLGNVHNIQGVWNGVDVSDIEVRQYNV